MLAGKCLTGLCVCVRETERAHYIQSDGAEIDQMHMYLRHLDLLDSGYHLYFNQLWLREANSTTRREQ